MTRSTRPALAGELTVIPALTMPRPSRLPVELVLVLVALPPGASFGAVPMPAGVIETSAGPYA